MRPLLEEVISGKFPNWRNKIVRGNTRDEACNRVMPHRLDQVNIGVKGDFSEKFVNSLIGYLVNEFNGLHCCDRVLLPTLLTWIVIVSFDISEKEANFYLDEGGHNNGKEGLRRVMETIRARKRYNKQIYFSKLNYPGSFKIRHKFN